MNPFATDPNGAHLAPDFAHTLGDALAALDAQTPVLHLWHAWGGPLAAARDAVLQSLRECGHPTHVCAQGEFLPLLQTLNTLIADSLRGAPLPTAQQLGVWVVDGAQGLAAPHAALIERILTHFPELPLRLVLLSQAPLAPLGPATARVLEVVMQQAPAPPWVAEPDLRAPSWRMPAGLHWGWWLGGPALLTLAAGGFWWTWEGARTPRAPNAASPAVLASAALPAVARASEEAATASAPASAAAPETPAAPTPVQPALAQSAEPVAVQASAAPAKTVPRSPLQAWVQALPEGSFLVLHGQFTSARDAEAFKASDPVLANARIAQAVWTDGQPLRYGVLTGPFRSSERVSNYVQRLAWRDQARSVGREALLALLSP